MNNPVQMSEDHKRLRDENNKFISMIKEMESEVRMLKQVVIDQQKQDRLVHQSGYNMIRGSLRTLDVLKPQYQDRTRDQRGNQLKLSREP